MYTKLVRESDSINFETPAKFTLTAKYDHLYTYGEFLKFTPTDVQTTFGGCYKSSVGKFEFARLQQDNFNVRIKPKLNYIVGPVKLRVGFKNKAHLKYEYKFKQPYVPTIKTDTKVVLKDLFEEAPKFEIYTENVFTYKISSLMAYYSRKGNLNNTEISAHLNLPQFSAAVFTNFNQKSYGVIGTSEINKYPVAFQLKNTPQGFDFRVGGKIKGVQNSLSLYIQNITTLCAKIELHFSKPLTFTGWMKTLVTNTENATYGFNINLDYDKLK
ncbi:hypothetical protein TVAG_343040 [Trichomonas vaginalis G3]|uniref:Uncharacterized protein n=1 Tax=Trichomonas vaginalis (strain ATCC PRA-98 / G3) TaxID=412133 RepID=A2EJR6_TRIV3|nr:hypothetical protein TVAGG3_0579870 [Trichomonas vaginalis G3]EAY07140.1 hypothetical protein TVAG_343040 [Trichomonas vaginalis G3]KAI5522495.1 hypothetical protein TVAGG3_0579870 [Trichomonas vaginalis G3]|eukprot:XP_001319363.1 hypothetical protein [Trichomonas vaginalis G3]